MASQLFTIRNGPLIGICVLLFACGFYENKYSQGIAKPPQDTTFYYQPVNLTWSQSYSSNDFGGVVHTMGLRNNLGKKIDSLNAIAIGFNSYNRNLSNIVFVTPIKYAHRINSFPSNSAIQTFQKTEANTVVGKEAYLLKASPVQAISLSGYYLGSFEIFKNSKSIQRGMAIGVIDYQGTANILPNSNLINRIRGIVDEAGEVTYDIIGSGNVFLQSGSAKVIISNSTLSAIAKINTSAADSISFNLKIVK